MTAKRRLTVAALGLLGTGAVLATTSPSKSVEQVSTSAESAQPLLLTDQLTAPAKVKRKRGVRFPAGACKASDGDTIRCGKVRVRLVEIDAPEMPGHCRKGRVCAPGDPYAAKKALADLIAGGVLVRPYAKDKYGRVVGDVRVLKGVSASCLLIRSGLVTRQLKWADYGVTAKC